MGQETLGKRSVMSILGNSAIMRAALSGEEVMRWNSFIHSDSWRLASGRKSVVQSWRKAGLSRPHPWRMRVSMALNCSVIMLPGGGHPRANAATRMSWVTRSGWRAA